MCQVKNTQNTANPEVVGSVSPVCTAVSLPLDYYRLRERRAARSRLARYILREIRIVDFDQRRVPRKLHSEFPQTPG